MLPTGAGPYKCFDLTATVSGFCTIAISPFLARRGDKLPAFFEREFAEDLKCGRREHGQVAID